MPEANVEALQRGYEALNRRVEPERLVERGDDLVAIVRQVPNPEDAL